MPVFYTVLKLQIRWQYISNIFGIQVPVLEMQINLMTVHLERIFRTSTPIFFSKTAPSRYFVENDDEGKLVLN